MKNLNLIIDTEKCIHCGLCIKDCSVKVLEFDENKVPCVAQGGENRCFKCQHCLAICPTGALSILDKNPENSDLISEHNSDELLNLIKSRRSIRHYKQENLNKETLEKLKSMLDWVPTGCNNHRLHFSFIDDIEVMNGFRNYVNGKIKKVVSKTPVNGPLKKFEKYKEAFLKGEDVIFRGAPHMIVVATPIDAPCAEIDPVIALSYFELYAQSLGVGTCWCGFAEFCLLIMPELCEKLEIPEKYKASYVMLFGTPDIKYSRTTQPEPYEKVSADKNTIICPGIIDKAKRYFWNFLR